MPLVMHEVSDSEVLSTRLHQLFSEPRDEWTSLYRKIEALNGKFAALAHNDPTTRRWNSILGNGLKM